MRSGIFKRCLSLLVIAVIATALVFSISSCSLNTCMHIDDTETVVEATCTEGGYTLHVCKTCGHETKTDETEPLGHTWGEGEITTLPTVDADGVKTFTCLDCSETRNETVKFDADAHYHSWNEGTVTLEPTCTEAGVKTFTCQCGEVKTEPVEKKGHAYADAVTAPTCTAQGFTTHTCSACNDSFVDSYVAATGHGSYTTTVVAATCEGKGYVRHTCGSCPYYFDDNVTVALGHSWGAPSTVTEATCISQGTVKYTCTRPDCQTSKTEPTAKVGHTYNAGVVTPATCSAHGFTTYTCTVDGCGDSYIANTTAMKSHDLPTVGTLSKAPTCTEAGEETFSCPNCSYVERREVAALGHDTTGNKPVKQESVTLSNSCTVNVVYVTACNNDGCEGIIQINEETVHQYKKQLVSEGNCETHSTYKNICTVCGDGADSEPIQGELGSHVWDNGQVIDSKTVYSCTVGECDATKSVVKTDDVKGNFTEDALNSTDGVVEIGGSDATIDFGIGNIGQIKDQQIKVEAIDIDDAQLHLTEQQKNKIGNNKVYDFGVGEGDTTFENGMVTVTVPYELANDEDPDNIAVWYVKNDGTVDKIRATYSNGYATFQTNHFSFYTVIRYTPEEYCAEFGHRFSDPATFFETCITGRYTLSKCEKCGVVERNDDPTHPATGHDFKETVVPATCKAAGYTLHSCKNANCEESYKDNYTPLADHDYKLVGTVPSTCNERGYDNYKCSVCSATKKETIEAYGEHKYGIAVVEKKATCTADGESKQTCSVCQDVKISAIAALGHEYTANVTAPTCVAEGYTLHTCQRCSDEYKDAPVPMLPHSYGTALNAPCTECGATCQHTFGKATYNNDATCTKDGTKTHACTLCGRGETVTAENTALGHSYINSVCSACGTVCTHTYGEYVNDNNATCTENGTKSHTCSECGKVESEQIPNTALGHKYGTDSVCKVCGDGCEHAWGGYVSDKNATCTKDGTETRTCEKCGKKETQTDDNSKTAHTYGDYVSNNDATCTKNATKTRACTACGDKETVEIENSKTKHIYGTDSICKVCGDGCEHEWSQYVANNNATCTENGTEYRTCGKCGAKEDREIQDSKLGHTYGSDFNCTVCGAACTHTFGDYVSNNDATCTEDGTETRTCSACGKTETRTDDGSMLDHTYGDYVSNNDATCGVDGTKTRECSVCGKPDTVTDEGSALKHEYVDYVCKHCGTPCAHVFGEFISNGDATCTKDGTETRTCSVCGKTETQTDEGTMTDHVYVDFACEKCGHVCEHTFGEWTVTVPATCKDNAKESATCSECGKVETREVEGSKLKHNYVDGVCSACGANEGSLFYTNLLLNKLADKYLIVLDNVKIGTIGTKYFGGGDMAFGDESKVFIGLTDEGKLLAYGTIVIRSAPKAESAIISVFEFALKGDTLAYSADTYTAGRGMKVSSESGKGTLDELLKPAGIDLATIEVIFGMLDELRENAYTAISEAKAGSDPEAIENISKTLVEFFFTLEEAEEGYTLSFRPECLGEIFEALTDKPFAETFDGVFGEKAFENTIKYLIDAYDLTLNEFVDDIKTTLAKAGVDIAAYYYLIEGMLPPKEDGSQMTVAEFLEQNGEITVGEFITAMMGGTDDPEDAPNMPEEEDKELLASDADVSTDTSTDSDATAPDADEEEDQMKAMYTQYVSQFGEMFKELSLVDFFVMMATGGNQSASPMISYVEAVIEDLAEALDVELSVDDSCFFKSGKLSMALTVLNSKYETMLGGSSSYEGETYLYFDLAITAGESFEFDVDAFLAGITNGFGSSGEVEDGVPETVIVPEDAESFGGAKISVDEDGTLYVSAIGDGDSKYVLVSRVPISAPSYSYPIASDSYYVNAEGVVVGKADANGELIETPEKEETNKDESGKDETGSTTTYTYKYYLETWVCFEVYVSTNVLKLDGKSCGDWYRYVADADDYEVHYQEIQVIETYDANGNLINTSRNHNTSGSCYYHDGFEICYNVKTGDVSFFDQECNYSYLPEGDITLGTGCGSAVRKCYKCTQCGAIRYSEDYNHHDLEIKATIVDGGSSCEDGVIISHVCKDCGEVYNTFDNVITNHELTKEEIISPTEKGYARIYIRSCTCGEHVEVDYDGGWNSFSTSKTDEDGIEHSYTIYSYYVSDTENYVFVSDEYEVYDKANCLVTVYEDYYLGVAQNDEGANTYARYLSTIYTTYDKHDNTVVKGDAVTSNPSEDRISISVTTTYTCSVCNSVTYETETEVYDLEDRLVETSAELKDDDGNIISYYCERYSWQFSQGRVVTYREMKADGEWEKVYYSYRSYCEYSVNREYLDADGNVIGSGNSGISGGHNYTTRYELAEGADDCTEGVICKAVCERCGETDPKSSEKTVYYHVNCYSRVEYDGLEFEIDSCPCGEMFNNVYPYFDYVSEDKGSVEIDGVYHERYYWYINEDKTYYVMEEYYSSQDEAEPCITLDVHRYAIVKDGEEVYEIIEMVDVNENHKCSESYDSTTTTDENGNHVYINTTVYSCENCDYEKVETNTEVYKEINRQKLIGKIHKVETDGVVEKYNETRFVYDEFGSRFDSYSRNGDMNDYVVVSSVYDFENCYRTTTYTSYKNGEISYTKPYGEGECHHNTCVYRLAEGSKSCEDGIIEYAICTRCNNEQENGHYTYHWQNPATVLKTANVHCGEVKLMTASCACGEEVSTYVKGVCEFQHVGSYDVNNSSEDGYEVSVWRCPVSDCGFTYTIQTVWGEKGEYCYTECDEVYRYGFMMPTTTSSEDGKYEDYDYSCYVDDSKAIFKYVEEATYSDYRHKTEFSNTTGTDGIRYEKWICSDCGVTTQEYRYNSLNQLIYEYWWNANNPYYVEREYDTIGRVIREKSVYTSYESLEVRTYTSRCEYEYVITYTDYESADKPKENKGTGNIHDRWCHSINESCTQYGTNVDVCHNCGATWVYDSVAPTGHTYTEVTENGETHYVCTKCGIENKTGVDGYFFMEDLTGRGGVLGGFAVGYFNRYGESADFNVTVTLKDGSTANLDHDRCLFYKIENSGTVELTYDEYYDNLKELGISSDDVVTVDFSFSVFDKESDTYITHETSIEVNSDAKQ